jgi:hypothetical protein
MFAEFKTVGSLLLDKSSNLVQTAVFAGAITLLCGLPSGCNHSSTPVAPLPAPVSRTGFSPKKVIKNLPTPVRKGAQFVGFRAETRLDDTFTEMVKVRFAIPEHQIPMLLDELRHRVSEEVERLELSFDEHHGESPGFLFVCENSHWKGRIICNATARKSKASGARYVTVIMEYTESGM